MKIATLALAILACIGTGCATGPSYKSVVASDLPDCFAANYDAQLNLFTIRGSDRNPANQQCALTVGPDRGVAASRISAGKYSISIANGGGGGAGGTWQSTGGGGGGGGAGAREIQATVDLTEGVYRLTIGAGGPGGDACVLAPYYFGGGPGWLGSPSNIVRVATGDVIAGTPGADSYARPSRAQHDQSSGKRDGHGGSGAGQTSGGHGGSATSATHAGILAESGQNRPGASGSGTGGIPGGNEDRASAGGGGGATSRADGGDGGGEAPGNPNRAPERGSLGSGGGGGEGGTLTCEAGARGGHGYIALRPI